MADSGIGDLRKQATDVWGSLGAPQKIAIGGIGLLSLVAIVFLLTWAKNPDYSTVFSNLQQEDAAAIVEKLKESKTPYQLASGGTAILVPTEMVYDTRLQLASAGLPQGAGVGFELFNQTNFGMTDFVQKVNYQRALEGELGRTINQLSPVEQSRVHIVIPQPTLYTDSQKDATASVVLKMKVGQRLNEKQIRGIAQLLGTSVEGLKTENITIVDASGNVLSDALSGAGSIYKANSSQLDGQKAFETDLEQRIQGMLDKVLGAGKATVRVQAQLNWDQYEASSEIYSPSNLLPQVRSQQQTLETNGGGPTSVGGAPGTMANVPSYTSLMTGTNTLGGAYQRNNSTTNYELSKTVEKTSKAAGGIKKLSVAVILDTPQADQSQMDEVTRLVSAASGIDPARGDVLAVSRMAFYREPATDDAKAMADAMELERTLQFGKIGAMAIGPVLLFALLLLLTRRSRSRSQPVAMLPNRTQAGIPAPAVVTAIGQATAEQIESANLATEDPRQKIVKEQVTNLVRTQPTAVADLIKNWMSEDVASGKYAFSNDIPTN